MDFIDACKKLIAIDSSPSNGTHEAAFFLKELAENMGFHVRIEEDLQRGLSEANIICFPQKVESKVHLMLQTHLDTVDPGSYSLWHHTGQNPFAATIHNSRIYGLGVADTKLDFLCKLYAAASFIQRESRRTFAIVGTYGEEYNMGGSIRLIRHKTLLADRVLVSEPTHFQLVYSGKGMANIEITLPFSREEMEARQKHDLGEGASTHSKMFKGKATHSSQPHLGINALENMLNYLAQLPEHLLVLEMDGGTNFNTIPVHALLEFDLVQMQGTTINKRVLDIYQKILALKSEFEQIQDVDFDPPMTTLNMGMMRTYSDHIKIMGCVRWPAKVKESVYLGWMDQLKSFCDQQHAIFNVRDYKKPFAMEQESGFAQDCMSVIQRFKPKSGFATQPVTNEANVFHKFGIETLVFGPGEREGNSQTSNESIEIENLTLAIQIYKGIIEKVCY